MSIRKRIAKNKKRKRKAIYLRVSREENESIEFHEAMLKELCGKEGIDLSEVDIFKEEALSGDNRNRPQLNALLANIDLYDTVIVKDIDRLSRDDSQAFDNKKLFWLNDVEILTPSRRYNFDNESDEMMYGMESMFAKIEHRKIKRRFKDGKVSRAKKGIWSAGPAPIGYRRDENGVLEPDPKDAAIIYLIFEMSAHGFGAKRIRQTLIEKGLVGKDKKFNLPIQHIRAIMKNRVYIGELHFTSYDGRGEIIEEVFVKDAHPPLVPLELFLKANEELERRNKNQYSVKGELKSYLQGVMKCKGCGNNIRTVRDTKKKVPVISFAKCESYSCEDPQSGVRACFIEEMFESELFKFRRNLEEALSRVDASSIAQAKEKVEKELADLGKQLKKVEGRLLRIKDMYEDGDLTKAEKNERMKRVLKDEQSLLDKQKVLQSRLEETSTLDNTEALLQLMERIDNFHRLSIQEKNDLVTSLVDKIVYERDNQQGHRLGRGQVMKGLELYPPKITIHWRTSFL